MIDKDKNNNIKLITEISMISAIYMTVSLLLAPFSFGATQVRVAEALAIVPVFKKRYIFGLTLGCFLTNFIGFFMGQNILGLVDSIFGTLATFFSCLLTYYLRDFKFKGLPVLATLPPVIINALVVGAELTFVMKGAIFNKFFWVNFMGVAIGQFISCTLIGLILFVALKNFMIKDNCN